MNVFKNNLLLWILILLECKDVPQAAVVAPPWANPKLNPCASKPGGWQLLYWPEDGKCYNIFQMGYPCADDMELSPSARGVGNNKEVEAECRCPPKTAQSKRDGRCYEIFSLGPCEKGQFFAPESSNNLTSKHRWGECQDIAECGNINEVFWPQNRKCYEKFTRGPCSKGQLLINGADKIATCKCNNKAELSDYFYSGRHGCYQHFTKGPCKEKGHLFLPDKTCGCHKYLPHYHNDTELCFEIGSIGPCNVGEYFQLDKSKQKGVCSCKKGYIRYKPNGTCYRPYTQGPCETGHFLVNSTTCLNQPCERSHLYYPENGNCYRIGSKGPCSSGRLVTFDFETRPSIDGISYNAICSCQKGSNCSEENACEKDLNSVLFRDKCYKLYTQGPCAKGAWIIPKRHKKEEIFSEKKNREGYCDCMPGFTKLIRTWKNRVIAECISPTVLLADYLNKNFLSFGISNSDQEK